jgi:hypothetical protein
MITSVTYTQPAPSQAILITMQDGTEWSTDASLPADTEIRRMLADWLAAGGQIAAYVAPPAPPREIHVAWFKAALADMGKLDAVDAAVATLPAAKQVMWEYATSINEADADVIAIAGALKINLAAVFDKAEAIRAEKLS